MSDVSPQPPLPLEQLFPVVISASAPPSRLAIDRRHPAPECAYSLYVPHDWTQVECARPLHGHIVEFRPLSRFSVAGYDQAWIEISLLLGSRECGPSELLDVLQTADGEQILQRRDQYTQSGAIPDVLSQWQDASGTWLSRSTIRKNGEWYLRLDCVAQARVFKQYAESFLIAIESFRFMTDEIDPYAERIAAYTHGALRIQIPDSWKRVTEPVPPLQPVVAMVGDDWLELEWHESDKEYGYLFVCQALGTAAYLEQIRLMYVQSLRQRGIRFNGLKIEPVTAPDDSGISGYSFDPNPIDNDPVPMSAPFVTLVQGEKLWLIGLITPASHDHRLVYSINKRAFEIVRDSLTCRDVWK